MNRRNLLKNLLSCVATAPIVTEGRQIILRNAHYTGTADYRNSSNLYQHQNDRYMKRAIELARNMPKYPFGALLVEQGRGAIVAEGWNRSVQNPTWHGEMDAINNCVTSHPKIDWSTLTLYTTAEPCAMCQGAVAWTGIGRVVFGSSIPYLKSLNWWAIDIRAEEVARRSPFHKCTVVGGVMEEECNKLFKAALTLQ